MVTCPHPGTSSCNPRRNLPSWAPRDLQSTLEHLRIISQRPILQRLIHALGPDQIFLVGGTVRDVVEGCMHTNGAHGDLDLDVAAALSIEEVANLCARHGIRTVETGIHHGTILAVVDDEKVEITTFRTPHDNSPSDNASHPLDRDLAGRDFTINALAYVFSAGTLIDPFGGFNDIHSATLRAVGDPAVRFDEDPLRVLRMIRFGAAAGRGIDDHTLTGASKFVGRLTHVAAERIRVELEKTLMEHFPTEGIRTLHAIGALPYTIPELLPAIGFEQNEFHVHDVFDHTLSVLDRTPPDKILRWAALFHDLGKPHTLSIDDDGRRHFYGHERVSETLALTRMEALRFSHADSSAIAVLVKQHMRALDGGAPSVRRIMRDLGDQIERWRTLKRADATPTFSSDQFDGVMQQFDELYEAEKERVARLASRRLAITGSDLLALGMKPGPQLGQILKQLEELVLDDPNQNARDVLLHHAQLLISNSNTGSGPGGSQLPE